MQLINPDRIYNQQTELQRQKWKIKQNSYLNRPWALELQEVYGVQIEWQQNDDALTQNIYMRTHRNLHADNLTRRNKIKSKLGDDKEFVLERIGLPEFRASIFRRQKIQPWLCWATRTGHTARESPIADRGDHKTRCQSPAHRGWQRFVDDEQC